MSGTPQQPSGNRGATVQPVAQRDDLGTVLDQYQTRLKQVVAKKQQQELERSRFSERFLALCRADWKQLLEDLTSRLGGAGHGASVFLNQERWQESLTLKLTPIDATGKPMESNCFIKMTANEAAMRVCFTVMTAARTSHSSSDEQYSLDELSVERLRSIIIRQIKMILDSVLPKEGH